MKTDLKNTPSSTSISSLSAPLLTLQNLSVKYRHQLALKNVSGQIAAGSLLAVLGPNGGGKSTFLKTLIGFHLPHKGFIHRHHLSQGQIAYLPQHAEIDRSFPLTVREVVAMGLIQEHGFFRNLENIYEKQIRDALDQVSLGKHLDRSLNTLSGGQFQRVLFARLTLQKAQLILLDEPFAAIDHATIEDLMKLILNWHRQGRTILIVTHDFDMVRSYFPQTLLLAKQVIAWGDTEEVLTPEHLRTAKNLSFHWENQLESETDEF